MRFLLDANVLLDFQNASLLPALAKAADVIQMAMAEQVFDEVTRPEPGDSSDLIGKKKQAALVLQFAPIEVLEIFPGTPAAALMRALVPLPSGRDQGEAASIALAASDPDLLFVTGDKKGVLWALNELFHSGERVMRVPVFVRTLFERGVLEAAALKGVAERAVAHGVIPSWWASWIAEQ